MRKRSVYMPMLMAIERKSMGTNEVRNRLNAQSNGKTAQNVIISQ